MENNVILTPKQVWEGYDPHKEPLRPSYLRFEEVNGNYEIEGYIDGELHTNEITRIYVKGYIPITSDINSNIIFINSFSEANIISFGQMQYTKQGFGVFSFDYYGKKKDSLKYTRYPKDISYANYEESGEHLNHATPTAKDTCVYIWDKVCMRTINFIKQLRGADSKIFLCGYQNGADIAWQVAAIDKRVDAVATILNAGWREYKDYPKLLGIEPPVDDERKRWFTGSATATYINFVKCPALCVISSNGTLTPLDRIEDTLSLIQKNKKMATLYIAVGLSDTITYTSRKLFSSWINAIAQNKQLIYNPEIKLTKAKDGTVKATIKADKISELAAVIVHYSYDELDPTLRSWSSENVSLSNLSTTIPVYTSTKLIFAYVSVTYANEVKLSSIPVHINIDDSFTRSPIKKNRIIYQKNFGTRGWILEQDKSLLEFLEAKIQEGPLGISGITGSYGNLSTYAIGDYKYKSDNQNLLQFVAAPRDNRKLEVKIITSTQGLYETYSTIVQLSGGVWTKCSLKISDFKTKDRIPLRDWGDIKKITFVDIKNTLINNIIWV